MILTHFNRIAYDLEKIIMSSEDKPKSSGSSINCRWSLTSEDLSGSLHYLNVHRKRYECLTNLNEISNFQSSFFWGGKSLFPASARKYVYSDKAN